MSASSSAPSSAAPPPSAAAALPATAAPAPQPQGVTGTAGGAALFVVLGVAPGAEAAATVRAWCADIAAHIRSLHVRAPAGQLRCVVGFGSDAWDRLFGGPRPRELHPFRALAAGDRRAPSTPGDVLLHIRAERPDLAFELASRLMHALGDAVTPIDEVHGFRFFDARSMIGFVDGTENPEGRDAEAAALVGDEDPGFRGGSYVMVQKYLHRMDAWYALSIDEQQRVIGRTKQDDIEFDDAVKPANAHSALTSITDDDGTELKILRANLPFGRPSEGEFGTYFIGYCRTPSITERMLSNMVIGDPPGNYDRLLDFSEAVTGTLFFAPSADLLEALADRPPAAVEAGRAGQADPGQADAPRTDLPQAAPERADPPAAPAAPRPGDGSLAIGSLRPAAGAPHLPETPASRAK